MNKFFILLAIFLCGASASAQLSHQINIQTGIYNNQVFRFATLVGASSYEHQNSISLRIGYQYKFNSRLSVKPSVLWQNSLLTANSISSNGEPLRQDVDLATINIPLLFSYQFNRFFFIDAGPVLHFETENQPQNYLDSQSGIGFSLGIGIQYNFSGFTAFAKPNLQLLSLLPFQKENYHERILSSGFVFGLGYNF